MGTAKENIGAAHDRCAAGQKERAGRVRPEMYESAPLGKFKSVDALLQAYNSLQAEFTRRSRRLRELEGKLAENAATAPAGGDEETAPVEKALGAAGQAENAFAPVAGTGGRACRGSRQAGRRAGERVRAMRRRHGKCGAGGRVRAMRRRHGKCGAGCRHGRVGTGRGGRIGRRGAAGSGRAGRPRKRGSARRRYDGEGAGRGTRPPSKRRWSAPCGARPRRCPI